MVNPGDLMGGAGGSIGASVDKVLFWVGYGFVGVLILVAMVGLYYYMQYKFKVIYMVRRNLGDTTEESIGIHSVGTIKKDRIREIKDSAGQIKWQFLFSRKKIPPLDYKHIFPGNYLFLYQTAKDVFIPTIFKCTNNTASFEPIPYDVKSMEQLEIQQAMQDYQKQNIWDKYGTVFVMAGTVLFCLILVGVTVWYTTGHANHAIDQISTSLVKAVQVAGAPPG